MTLARAYVAVRDIQAGSLDPEAGDYHPGAGGPVVPGAWTVSTQIPGFHWMLTTPTGELLCARLVNQVGSRGLFAVFGPPDILDAIAAGNGEVMPAREAWRRRGDNTSAPGEASPQQMVRAWPWYRCTLDGVDGVHRLIGVGELLPATALPWVLPVGTVTAVVRPALPWTLAGQGMASAVEDEPDL